MGPWMIRRGFHNFGGESYPEPFNMPLIRRRTALDDQSRNGKQQSANDPSKTIPSRKKPLLYSIFIAVFIVAWLSYLARTGLKSPKMSTFTLSESAKPDDEDQITLGRLSLEDSVPSTYKEGMLACMPTVSREGVEYISNAVKSWRIATNGSHTIRRLIIFEMDNSKSNKNSSSSFPDWLGRVFFDNVGIKRLPSWLEIHQRQGEAREARKQTLGDSKSRVNWRSKEAQDYAQVLKRCTEMVATSAKYVLIVQDDVLFTSGIQNAVHWADEVLKEKEYFDERRGKNTMQRICSGSLFDITPHQGDDLHNSPLSKDGHVQHKSNMVAKIWQLSFAARVVQYIERNYDEKPVDWLVDDMCRHGRRATLVMEPNTVRHRGAVSSFPANQRHGLLT